MICSTECAHRYFFHEEKGASSWEHPSDEFFRKLYHRAKLVEEQLKSSAKGNVAATLENSELRSQMEKLKKKHEDLKQSADRVLRENDDLNGKAAGLEQVIFCVLDTNT